MNFQIKDKDRSFMFPILFVSQIFWAVRFFGELVCKRKDKLGTPKKATALSAPIFDFHYNRYCLF
jgi:hypothetical protein